MQSNIDLVFRLSASTDLRKISREEVVHGRMLSIPELKLISKGENARFYVVLKRLQRLKLDISAPLSPPVLFENASFRVLNLDFDNEAP